MPMLGLGTWVLESKDAYNAVLWALQAGYRHIDTAAYYENEREVGKAVKDSRIRQSEIFVTTKIRNEDHDDPQGAFEKSLKRLGLDYLDLYLIHWPVKERNETWRILEKLLEERKTRAIGVSNFTIRHLQQLLKNAKVVPAVNQVEFSPYLYQRELLDFCRKHDIQLEAYSPLTRGRKLRDQKLVAVAQKYGKTPAQVLIKWALQHGLVVIPKSKSKERIIENAGVFDFTIAPQDMKLLDSFNENFRTCWDPTNIL